MKKKLFRTMSWLLALMLLLSSFASCSWGKEDDVTDEGTQTDQPSAESLTVTEFTVEMLSSMKIVYPYGAAEELVVKVDSLRTLIKSIYGVDMMVTSDYLREGSEVYCEIPNEILVGETNRAADDAYYKNLRYEDYGYITSGGKIIIGGNNLQAIHNALSDFSYNIVMKKKGGDQIFFCTDFAMEYKAEYKVSDILLNGVSFQEYRIVYPANGTKFEKQLATHVVTNLQKLTGYRLDIVSDKTAYADGYEILIGKTNRSDTLYTKTTGELEGCIASAGKFIVLYGDSARGNAIAASELTARIESAISKKGENISLTLANAEIIQDSETISNITYNILSGNVTAERSAQVIELLLRYLPDVICLQEVSNAWLPKIDNNLTEYYGCVGEGSVGGSNTGGTFNKVLYSKDRFELLKTDTKWLTDTPDEVSMITGSGWERIVTYVLLKDRVTGETICVANTHLDFGAPRYEQVKYLFNILFDEGLEDYPFVLTGDMNTYINSNELRYMMGMGLASANEIADVVDKLPEIDFIMVSEDCIDVSYARVCDETILGAVPSDHPATYAEYKVVIPEGGVDHDFREPLPVFPDDWLDVDRDENDQFGDINLAPPIGVGLSE